MIHWTKVKMWLFAHGVTCFHEYGVIRNKEAENLLRMNGLENQQRERGAEVLVSFPLPDEIYFWQEHLAVGAEHTTVVVLQEQPVDRLSTDRCL
ncbi:hypothetical protein AVEN_57637-1 [Araneus ventricosus]|uniref:Uncharacterized protein n=1 Tax=Araneus ventricosus TaxID=182803 RepID=A0A4Y2QPM0_ARAVE|nr:hypothetical protein AVEN_57637-1 [Araneus ventricosus]